MRIKVTITDNTKKVIKTEEDKRKLEQEFSEALKDFKW